MGRQIDRVPEARTDSNMGTTQTENLTHGTDTPNREQYHKRLFRVCVCIHFATLCMFLPFSLCDPSLCCVVIALICKEVIHYGEIQSFSEFFLAGPFLKMPKRRTKYYVKYKRIKH
jgi:hypothetical protein